MTATDKCAMDGCQNPSRCRGWCAMHYTRWLRHGDPAIRLYIPADSEREYVLNHFQVMPSGCWEWTGARSDAGYGVFSFHGRHFYAHRVALAVWTGTDPGEHYVLHACDNPPCVSPDHISAGTHAQNMREAWDRSGRREREAARITIARSLVGILRERAPQSVPMRELCDRFYRDVPHRVAKGRVGWLFHRLREQGTSIETMPDGGGYRLAVPA